MNPCANQSVRLVFMLRLGTPSRVEVYDVLQVVVAGTLLDQPIDGPYMVNGEGKVHLGPAYGSVCG